MKKRIIPLMTVLCLLLCLLPSAAFAAETGGTVDTSRSYNFELTAERGQTEVKAAPGDIITVSLVLLYGLAQGRRQPLREVMPGVCGSLAAWMVLSMAFSYYVETMGRYSVLYGSIATVIVVLLWLYMSGQVLILGAEFSAALLDEKRAGGAKEDI